MSNDDDNNRLMIQKAFRAVQQHVLPGLAAAWDESNPAVLLVTELAVAQIYLEAGFDIEALFEAMRALVAPAVVMRPKSV